MANNPAQKTYNVAVTKGGAVIARDISVVATGVVIKNSPGQIYSIHAVNINAAARYLKVYDKATAPTQADTPALTIHLPATGSREILFPIGVEFSAGISIRVTTGVADNDTGAPTVNETIVNMTYK
jgi:hypothetical protein